MFGNSETTKPLSDCIGTTFPGEWGEEDSDGTGVNVIRTTNFTNSGKLDLTNVVTRKIDQAKIDKKHLIPGDIILERSGGTADNPVGRVVYFEAIGTFLFNNFTQLLRCKEGVNSLFVFYSLYNYYHTHKSEIRSMGNKTTGIQNLKMDKYWDIPIAEVSPVQQEQFVSLYKQADKSKFKGFKSRFIEMFGQVGDTQRRYPIKQMEECCSYISDGSHYSPTEDSQGAYPMLSVKDMTDNGFSYSDCKYIGSIDYEKLVANGCKPQKNDVLVAKDGSYFKYAFVVDEDKEQAILSSIAILRPDSEMVRPRYLAYYMLTDAVVKLVEKNYLTGTAIRRVILKGFKVLPVIVPDLETQDEFIHILEQADKSKYLS